MLRKELVEILRNAAGVSADISFSLEAPPRPELGDYATNLPIVLARRENKNPMEVAEKLKQVVHNPMISDVSTAPPGFLNITLSEELLKSELERILSHPHTYGNNAEGGGKTVVLDYFGLNAAKPPHVGHLRSAVIGDALKRLMLASGYHTIADSHIGDWGTQFGILLYAYKTLGDKSRVEKDPLNELNELYIAANAKIDEDPEVRELAKAEFAKLEAGDTENQALWAWMARISVEKLEELVRFLDLLPFEEHRGESAYEETMPGIVEEALLKGVARKEGSAVLVDLKDEKLDEAILIKSDGASTYLLRDLATIKYRIERWRSDKNIYVVDMRQSHHFRQVFRVAELLGWQGGENIHADFGYMTLPEGALSTRKGKTLLLADVVRKIVARARVVIEKKNPELPNKEKVAHAIGIGALKYFDLSHHRRSDIVFNLDEALSFEGDTGPYIQYTHARLSSILRKANQTSEGIDFALDPTERNLLIRLIRFSDAVEDAAKDLVPNMVTQYLSLLSQQANNFYHSHPVLQENDISKRTLKLALVEATANILKRGLFLLGIEAPGEM